MKRKLGIIVWILFLTFGFASNALSQWVFMAQPFQLHPHLPPSGGAWAIGGDAQNLFAGGYKGVFHSTDQGTTWISIGFPDQEVRNLLADTENVFVPNFGIHRSSDNGNTWTNLDSGSLGTVYSIAKLGSMLFANCSYKKSNYLTIVHSSDNGISWIPSDSGAEWDQEITSFAKVGSTLFAGTSAGIIRSTNDGTNWDKFNPAFVPVIYCLAVNGTSLFAGTATCIFRSSDSGMNWDTVYKNSGMAEVTSIIVHDTTIFASEYLIKVVRSTDNGASWHDVSAGLNSGINMLAPAGNFLFAATIEGIWRRSFADLSDVNENLTQPDLYISLSPNPTMGVITVHNTSVNILNVTVTNILGESVLELAHPNSSDLTLDLSKLPVGTYFVRFSLAGSVITRKIVKE